MSFGLIRVRECGPEHLRVSSGIRECVYLDVRLPVDPYVQSGEAHAVSYLRNAKPIWPKFAPELFEVSLALPMSGPRS
jgi:hypothetical protein